MAGRKKSGGAGIEDMVAEQKEQAPGIEEHFLRLDEITASMEKEDITLEESFRLFREGMELVKLCGEKLQDVEKQMIVLEEEYPR